MLAVVAFARNAALSAEETAPCGMRYVIDYPAGLGKNKPAPLLIALHGNGGAPQSVKGQLAGCSSWSNNYIRVYPYPSASDRRFDQPDVDKIADIIVSLKKKFRISHVITFGFSGGSFIALDVGLRHTKLVNGSIVHSGGCSYGENVPSDDNTKRLAIALICGTSDPGQLPMARTANDAFKKAGYKWVYFKEVPGLGHTVDSGKVNDAYNWMMGVFKQGGGGGAAPWTVDDLKKKFDAALALAKEKKPADAVKSLEELESSSRQMSAENGKQLLEMLKPLLKDNSSETRIFAVEALGFCGPDGAKELKKALADFKEDEPALLAAVRGLGRSGEDGVQPLIGALKGAEFEYRPALAAVEELRKIADPEAAKPLVDLLAKCEKKPDEIGKVLREPVEKALKEITGASCASSAEWNNWLRDNKKKK
jgi:predicted esterase